ncbi:hypothetical protein [Photobacterium sp.]|uniref:hypothetical protein n=1 Tax=Photobacterium sp. TaxID=660 RepID=UPI00299E341B|nr:hypothetical protein [Photobacterium sp.]MDX1304558.1 hypothetical protein [Photobacterium sp.]
MKYILILLVLLSSNLHAFTIDANEDDWNDSNSLNIKAENNEFNYRIANDSNNIYILIKKITSNFIPIYNNGITFFIPTGNDFYVFISSENETTIPTIGLKNDTALLNLSTKPWAYSYNSGLYTQSGNSGFVVKSNSNYIEIKYPKNLLQAHNKKFKITIGDTDLAYNLENKTAPQQTDRFLRKFFDYDYSGAVAQSIVDQKLSGGQVKTSGYASITYSEGPLSGTVHAFYDKKNGLNLHVSINSSKEYKPSKPKKFPIDVALGIAMHSGNPNVFENLGASAQAGHLGVAFTVNDKMEITTAGSIMYVTTDVLPSVSGAFEKAIYEDLFGKYNIWSGLQLALDSELTGMPSNDYKTIDGIAVSKKNLADNGSSSSSSSSSSRDRDGRNDNHSASQDYTITATETDLNTGETREVDLSRDPADAGTTGDNDDNDGGWW